nr:MAG TPA: hypothetical protein [Caudoviricetes sp.]
MYLIGFLFLVRAECLIVAALYYNGIILDGGS